MGALDARAGGIRLTELVCGLPPSHGLKRVVVLAGLQADDARLPLCSCALRPRRAGRPAVRGKQPLAKKSSSVQTS